MINRHLLKIQRQPALGENLTLEKSMVISENVIFWDLDNSASTIRVRNKRNTQVRKSMVISGIMYPASTFLAKKLKRILQAHILRAFNKIKDNRKQIINLNLLSQKYKRSLQSGFFEIRFFHQLHKGSQLQSIISRNKRPHLIYHAVAKAVKNKQCYVIQRIVKFTQRKKNVEKFTKKLEHFLNSAIIRYLKKIFMRSLKQMLSNYINKIEGAEVIGRLMPKIRKRIKLQALRSIARSIQLQELQDVNLLKKQAAFRMNQTSAQRARAFNNERQKIRNIKNDLDTYSADRSKTKYQVRKDINILRSKLREDQKKSRVTIFQLNQEVDGLEAELVQIHRLSKKRVNKTGQNGEDKVKGLFIELQKLQANKVGEVCPSWRKQEWGTFSMHGDSLDEIHVHRNQKLRQLIMEYQSTDIKGTENIVIEQNTSLKEMIQCIIRRALQNTISKYKLKQLYQ